MAHTHVWYSRWGRFGFCTCFTSGTQLANNTVIGGAGTDTLVLTAAATLTDVQLAKVSGVEVIQASSFASNSITLGANALAGGVSTLKEK
jgi:hypothetical protein